MSDSKILLLNPLGSTLKHYECELIDTLNGAGYTTVEVLPTIGADGVAGVGERVRITAASAFERFRLGFSVRGQVIIVVWPMFGYLDPLSLWTLCRNNRVHFVLHDPTPLRREYGHSRLSRRLFKIVTSATNSKVIYHTELAQRTGNASCGIPGFVSPHPICNTRAVQPSVPQPLETNQVIRVLGQYKQTRTLRALEQIAAQFEDMSRLEIHGRGWPSVKGWEVFNRFVPEDEFDSLIQSSNCVVIPYDSFFQSGVAVRSLEHGVPVVAPLHEHIAELYGADWPGLVGGDNDWHRAIVQALKVDRNRILARADETRVQISSRWSRILDG